MCLRSPCLDSDTGICCSSNNARRPPSRLTGSECSDSKHTTSQRCHRPARCPVPAGNARIRSIRSDQRPPSRRHAVPPSTVPASRHRAVLLQRTEPTRRTCSVRILLPAAHLYIQSQRVYSHPCRLRNAVQFCAREASSASRGLGEFYSLRFPTSNGIGRATGTRPRP